MSTDSPHRAAGTTKSSPPPEAPASDQDLSQRGDEALVMMATEGGCPAAVNALAVQTANWAGLIGSGGANAEAALAALAAMETPRQTYSLTVAQADIDDAQTEGAALVTFVSAQEPLMVYGLFKRDGMNLQ